LLGSKHFTAAVSHSGLTDLVRLSDDEVHSLEESLLPSEEDESIISSWVADLPQQTQQMQEQEQQPDIGAATGCASSGRR
jgi:hypothetical protein